MNIEYTIVKNDDKKGFEAFWTKPLLKGEEKRGVSMIGLDDDLEDTYCFLADDEVVYLSETEARGMKNA